MKYFTLDRWIEVLQQLGRQGGSILTFQALSLASGLREEATRKALRRLEVKGYVKRLGKMLYANSLFPPTLEEVAMILGYPCYVSFESGLERHGLISQMPVVITCASAVESGSKETPFGEIVFHRLKPGKSSFIVSSPPCSSATLRPVGFCAPSRRRRCSISSTSASGPKAGFHPSTNWPGSAWTAPGLRGGHSVTPAV